MSKSKILLVISLVFIGLGFASCDDEPIDPTLNPANNIPTDDCGAPLTFLASDFVGGTSVNLSWAVAPGTATWQIQYGIEGFAVGSGTQITATDDEVTVTGLTATNEYEFYIRTVCGPTSFSGWVGPISVGGSIGSCPMPTSVTAVRTASNTEINVSWTPAAGTSGWQVQYGTAGFALGSGTTVASATSTKTITGVVAATAYDFYVRTNCSAGANSNWVGPIQVGAASVSSGDYWPTSIGNQWVYIQDGTLQDPFAIVSTDVVGGNSYFTFTTPAQPNTATTRIRKSGGNYYIKTEQITHTTPMPGTTTGNEIIILKDYLNVGATWTDSFVQTTTYTSLPPQVLNMTIVNTVEEKNVTATVNGETFNNVIKIKRVMTYSGASTGVTVGYYWFAKDIGPVKIINGTITQEIESYIVN